MPSVWKEVSLSISLSPSLSLSPGDAPRHRAGLGHGEGSPGGPGPAGRTTAPGAPSPRRSHALLQDAVVEVAGEDAQEADG